MRDFSFGNTLAELRRKAGLSQKEVAAFAGVSNKAVSKWENGAARPTVAVLEKLAELYGVSTEALLKQREKQDEQKIVKIVLTGGPCAGKTTAMSWIENAFTQMGYRVLFVPETATELISGGVAPWTCASNLDYQCCQMQLQQQKEEIFLQAARSMHAAKVLIVCDRGQLDNRAYMSQQEFFAVLHRLGWNEVALRDGYDAVFHLVTAAKGAQEYYTTANNAARTETVEKAAALDDQLIAAWTGHPHLRIIDNTSNFEGKMRRLIAEVSAFLGEPEPFEIERKFLIAYPDVARMERECSCRKVEIIQTYLTAPEGEERRVRQRGADGNYLYYETVKHAVSPRKRVEVERRLTQSEYLNLLMEADPRKRPIRKTRCCLTWQGQYFEVDLYPFWKDRAIAEIELRTEEEEIHFPPFLKLLREVTEEEQYRNAALAEGD